MTNRELTTLVAQRTDFKGVIAPGSSVVVSKEVSDKLIAVGRTAFLTLDALESYPVQLTRPCGRKGEHYLLLGKPVDYKV